jgi:flagellar basal-body rod modification protein FlgD
MQVNGIDTIYALAGSTARDPSSVLGKDDFLRLLTVQLQHQDPLTPLDNEDLIAQLAQFSSLEQLENINSNLQNNMDLDLILTQVLNNTAAAGLIGKTVVAEGDQVALDSSGSTTIHFDLASDAKRVVVRILDEGGAVINTIEQQDLLQGRNEFTWDGKDSSGNSRGEGTYQVTIEAFDREGNPVDSRPLTIGQITGVKFEDGEARLMVHGIMVGIAEILEILAETPA